MKPTGEQHAIVTLAEMHAAEVAAREQFKALRKSGDDAIADAAEIFKRIRAHNGCTPSDVRAAEVWLDNANMAIRRA